MDCDGCPDEEVMMGVPYNLQVLRDLLQWFKDTYPEYTKIDGSYSSYENTVDAVDRAVQDGA